jgi:alkylation response protein AidB-like acyl-CoA dehydrogenase
MVAMVDYGTQICKGKDDFLRPDHLISAQDKMMIASLREFVDKEVLPHETEIDDYWDWTEREEPTFVHDLKKKLYVDIGLQAALVPEAYGGMGLTSIVGANLAAEELARGDLGLATEVQMNHWGMTSIIPPTQNDTLLKEFAPKLCGKEVFQICSCLTEPTAGGSVEDVAMKGKEIQTTCRLEGGEWVINGHKLWGSAFRTADLYRVLCRVEGESYPRNIAQIYVPAKTPGLKTGKPYRKMGCSLDTNGDVWFENVRVPKYYRAHEDPEQDLKSLIINETYGRAMPTTGCTLGIMKRAYEILKEWVDGRRIGGIPMKEHGVIINELGKFAQDIMTAEAYIYSVAYRFDHPEVYGDPSDFKNLIVSDACKKTVGDLGFRAVNRALELMGSHGYSREGKMEKLLRDVKITQIWVGGPLLYLTELSRYFFGTKTM